MPSKTPQSLDIWPPLPRGCVLGFVFVAIPFTVFCYKLGQFLSFAGGTGVGPPAWQHLRYLEMLGIFGLLMVIAIGGLRRWRPLPMLLLLLLLVATWVMWFAVLFDGLRLPYDTSLESFPFVAHG